MNLIKRTSLLLAMAALFPLAAHATGDAAGHELTIDSSAVSDFLGKIGGSQSSFDDLVKQNGLQNWGGVDLLSWFKKPGASNAFESNIKSLESDISNALKDLTSSWGKDKGNGTPLPMPNLGDLFGDHGHDFGGDLSRCRPPAIPEPGTYALMGLGLVGVAFAARRAKRAA